MAEKSTATLKCGSCSHNNEPERVYCHNCGEKLDRSILPKQEETKDKAKADKNAKRVSKMMNPQGLKLKKEAKTLAKVLAFAALIAALALYWLPPDAVPPTKSDVIADRPLNEVWEQMMATKAAVAVGMSAVDVNLYLKSALKASESTVPGVKFERAFVNFEPGTYTITAQRDAWSLKMYSSVTYRPVVKDGKVSTEVIGAHYGRLGVPPSLHAVVDFAVGAVVKPFAKELKQIDRLANVQVGAGRVVLTTKPQP